MASSPVSAVLTNAILALLLVGCATGPSGKVFDSAEGEWRTRMIWNEGGAAQSTRMTIIDETRATYEWRDGQVQFTRVDDQGRWEGFWIDSWAKNYPCPEAKEGSNAWGVLVLQFNPEFNEFMGEWDYCGKGSKYPWNGNR